MSLQRKALWDKVKNEPSALRAQKLFEIIQGEMNQRAQDVDDKKLQTAISRFLSKLTAKQKACHHIQERFLEREKNWLLGNLPDDFVKARSTLPEAGPGRPKAPFTSLTDSGKRKRIESLVLTKETEELVYAAEMSVKNSGQSLTKQCACKAPKTICCDEAVALFSQAKLTREQYTFIRQMLIEHDVDIMPSYQKVLEAKKRCYPANGVTISEKKATITLQAVADLSAERLTETLMPVIQSRPEVNFVLTWKYGFDGSSDHSVYHQRVTEDMDESRLLFSAAVMLQLHAQLLDGRFLLIWQNTRPGSTRFCRPIEFEHTKETQEMIREKSGALKMQISGLETTTVKLHDARCIDIRHRFVESMMDGKVVNTLDDTPSSNCNVCSATPSKMNDLDYLAGLPENPNALERGLPILHSWIRTFEMFLHIAYRLDFQKSHSVYTVKEKQQMQEKKAKVQENLRTSIGIVADQPRTGGKGNSNCGNSARRFFEKPDLTSQATGLDESLLVQFRTILITIASGHPVDLIAFNNFAKMTAENYVGKYGWYKMPPSVHKILVHGASFMRVAPVPLGLLTEEPLECRHKDIRYFRRHHTRKCNRVAGNEDLLHSLLISSDPVINSYRKQPQKKAYCFDQEVRRLLKSPEMICDLHFYEIQDDSDSED